MAIALAEHVEPRARGVRAPALPAQPIPGGGSEGGRSPPPSRMSTWPLLSIITWAPFAGAVLIMFTARHRPLLVRGLAIGSTGLSLLCSLLIYVTYDREAASFQFYEEVALVPPLGIKYQLGVDGM